MKILNKDLSSYYPLLFTIVFIAVLIQYSFSTFEGIFYDLAVRYDVGYSYKGKIVLISLDEKSDEFLGDEAPYTYASHLKLLRRVISDSPAVIASFSGFGNELKAQKETERENQRLFVEVIKEYESAGGTFLVNESSPHKLSAQMKNFNPSAFFGTLVQVYEEHFPSDGVFRVAVLNEGGEQALHLKIANAFREFKGKSEVNATDYKGAHYMREVDAIVAPFRYALNPANQEDQILSVPFHHVANGAIKEGFFKDKIILIGTKYASIPADYVKTPFSRDKPISPKLGVHALIIQALLDNKTVYRIPPLVTDIFSIILALFLSFVISRISPMRGLSLIALMIACVFFIAFLLFNLFGIWLNITHLVLTIFTIYYIWVPIRAIGEYKQRYAIQEESKLLKKIDKLKQNFISLMSHDLKTPVAKISGIAEILEAQYDNSERQKQHIRDITTATRDLDKFITSILDLTKVESQNLEIKLVSRDINKIIEDILEKLRFEANQNNIKIETDLSPLYPIKMDPELMKRIISNLVENGIKYSGENSVIRLKSWDDEKWVYLEIKDSGAGIAKEDLENIFEKFYRIKNDASHSIKGTGLGLYLVKYFVELHEGKIVVDSTLGKGTSFTLKFKNA